MRCCTQVSVSSVKPFIFTKFTGKNPTLFHTCKTILIYKLKAISSYSVVSFKFVQTYLA